MNSAASSFDSLDEIATHLRDRLGQKKYVLLFAFNGTGKTRLSMTFKEPGKETVEDGRGNEETTCDTLYFNAFTEDLFHWESDAKWGLRLNRHSHFFDGLQELEMESRIGPVTTRTPFHARLVNVLSHGNYSLYEPREMLPENKDYFRKILRDFMNNYRFNPELFPVAEGAQT